MNENVPSLGPMCVQQKPGGIQTSRWRVGSLLIPARISFIRIHLAASEDSPCLYKESENWAHALPSTSHWKVRPFSVLPPPLHCAHMPLALVS
jgi:hypothetical protein